jgi:alkylation response protein AidB-like acyl-CoA dehydrogenase
MNFALDDDQQLIVETVRRFAERDLRGWSAEADRAGAAPDRLATVGGDLGFFTDAVPADAGGMLEGAYSHATRALRGYELGRGCAALAALLETNVEPALAVGKWGSAAAKSALFASLTSGGLAAFAHDSRGLVTLDGDRITGKIGPVPALARAKHVVIALSNALVLATPEGVTAMTPSGWRAGAWATATFAGAQVEVLSRDAAAIAEVLSWARVSLAARAAGVASVAMDHADAYAKERIQFGQAIGTFESLIRLRDDAQTAAHAAKIVAIHAAWAIDTHQQNAADLASRARVIGGDTVARATIDAVQIFGGYGFVNDYPVEKLMRDARAFEALHGDERLGRVLAQKAVQ